MTKVLVLTRMFRGVPMGYGSEFQKRGCEVRTVTSEVECSKWNIVYRIRKRLGLSNERYLERKAIDFAKKINEICEEFSPDIIYVCHGTQLRGQDIDALKEKYYIVVDLIDRLEFFPSLLDRVGHYHKVYSYIKADCEFLEERGVNCKYLPAIGNPEVFYPLNITKDIDICFVGATYPEKYYGDRLVILDRLIADFPDRRIFVGGACAPLRRPVKFFSWLLNSKRRKVYNNRDITSDECNTIYNRSKICLNINRINTGEGWSERLGNIMFSGSFQIVTSNEAIKKTFGEMLDTFASYEELKEKIEFYLSDEPMLAEKTKLGHELYLEKVAEMKADLDIVDDVLQGLSEYKGARM